MQSKSSDQTNLSVHITPKPSPGEQINSAGRLLEHHKAPNSTLWKSLQIEWCSGRERQKHLKSVLGAQTVPRQIRRADGSRSHSSSRSCNSMAATPKSESPNSSVQPAAGSQVELNSAGEKLWMDTENHHYTHR
ncbi:hypothetical protein SAY87_001278 [Trapa incisa]|uniref:Uncharacterized protein n=1 Tax=Trapa incisa TaxID=236973 RepID=A0AAN7GV16_9MYRT|nr:hypothetical protein SAY87_001278 [Trapa incisa]